MDAWKRGWAEHDSVSVAERYAANCTFSSHPLRPTVRGRAAAAAWIRDAFAEESSARFVFGLPIVADDRAAVEYRAIITDQDGVETTLAGTTILRFDETGLVIEHRDYWTTSAGDLGLDLPMEASA
ncbi:MAG TPA: nuclear transport factor 2 family protein [Candidatus Limnocylindrales bacterium]|nr:nuclear transport factor 2 family protein [Candidatus Limnocylindrales bacterium]